MKRSQLEYSLPPELIAQHPAQRRDGSRLLVYDRSTGDVRHRFFWELPDELRGELVVVNDTRVVPARLRFRRPTGGDAEVLLLEPLDAAGEWEGLARPTRKLRPGQRLGSVELIEHLGEGRWRLRLTGDPAGEAPLPPYITEPLADPERYQTVYADREGSAAAPTAGLHFTPELLAKLDVERVTLHVGLDTFRPVDGRRPRGAHDPHGALRGRARGVEAHPRQPTAFWPSARRPSACSSRSRQARRSRAGRTSSSPLRSSSGGRMRCSTNFHLPGSTLLALVMAFAGVDEILRLYELAIEERYRFYSFGDAMLIL